MVSDVNDTDLFVATFRAGARAWVRASASVEELMRVIHGVARGETWVPPDLLTVLLQTLLTSEGAKEEAQDALSVLSAREREILECLAQGMTRAEIVERFTLSPHTVRTHIGHVLHEARGPQHLVGRVDRPQSRSRAPDDRDAGDESTAAHPVRRHR